MHKHQFIKSVLTISLSIAIPLQAGAFQDPTEFDSNGDGKVTAQEIQAGLSALFTKIDTTGDKYLSLAEIQAWRASEQVDRFNALDTDKSSTLSLAELQATGTQKQFPENITEEIFNLLDSDKNASLTWDEYAVLEPGKGQMIRHFARMDTDNDLQISETEFLTAPTPGQGGPGGHHGHP